VLRLKGFDISAVVTERASYLYPNLSFLCVNILTDENSPLEGTFDVIYIKDVFYA
jgi:hypothetical protein